MNSEQIPSTLQVPAYNQDMLEEEAIQQEELEQRKELQELLNRELDEFQLDLDLESSAPTPAKLSMYQSGKSTSYQQNDQNSISDSLPFSNPTQPISTCVYSNSIQQSSSSPQQLPSQISPEFYAAYLASLSQPIPNSIIPNDYPNPTNGASYDPRQQSTMQSTTGNPLPFNYPVQGITGMACVLSPSQASSWNSNVKSDPSAIAQLNNSAPLMISSTTFDNSPKLSDENNCRDASNKIIVEQHSDSMSVSCSQKPDSHLDPAFSMTPETSAADNSALNTSHPEPQRSSESISGESGVGLGLGHSSGVYSDRAQVEALYRARGRRIDELSAQIDQMSGAHETEVRNLKHRIVLLEAEKDGLQMSLTESQKLYATALEQVTSLQRAIDGSNQRFVQLEEEKSEMIKKLADYECLLEEQRKAIAEYSGANSYSKQREQMNSLLSALREKKEREIVELNAEIDALKKERNEKHNDFSDLRERSQAQVKQLEEALASKSDMVTQLARQLHEAQLECQQLLDSSAVHELQRYKLELQMISSRYQGLEASNFQLQNQLRDLQEQVDLYESAAQFGIYACSSSILPSSRNASAIMNTPSANRSGSTCTSTTLSEAQALVSAAEALAQSRSLEDSGTAAAREPELADQLPVTPSAPPHAPAPTAAAGTYGSGNGNVNSSLFLQSSPNPAPATSLPHIRSEFERCLEAFRSKRLQVTKLHGEVCALKKELAESKKRLEKADTLAKELREQLEKKEKILSDLDPLGNGKTVKEIRLQRELDSARAELENCSSDIKKKEAQLAETIAKCERLSAESAASEARVAAVVDAAERDRQAACEAFQRTCEEHYEHCKKMHESELAAAFAAERQQLALRSREQIDASRAESAALHEELSRTKELYVALSKDRDTQIEKLKEEHSSQISALKLSLREDFDKELAIELEKKTLDLHEDFLTQLVAEQTKVRVECEQEFTTRINTQLEAARSEWLQEQTRACDEAVARARLEAENEKEKRVLELQAQHQSELDSLQAMLKSSESRVSELETELKQHDAELAALESAHVQHSRQLEKEFETRCEQLCAQIRQEESQRFNSQITSAADANTKMLEEQRKALANAKDEARAEAEARYSALIEALEARSQEAEAALSAARAENEAMARLKRERDANDAALAALRDKYAHTMRQVKEQVAQHVAGTNLRASRTVRLELLRERQRAFRKITLHCFGQVRELLLRLPITPCPGQSQAATSYGAGPNSTYTVAPEVVDKRSVLALLDGLVHSSNEYFERHIERDVGANTSQSAPASFVIADSEPVSKECGAKENTAFLSVMAQCGSNCSSELSSFLRNETAVDSNSTPPVTANPRSHDVAFRAIVTSPAPRDAAFKMLGPATSTPAPAARRPLGPSKLTAN